MLFWGGALFKTAFKYIQVKVVLPNIGKVQLLRTSRSQFDSALCGLGKMAPKAMLCTDLAGMLHVLSVPVPAYQYGIIQLDLVTVPCTQCASTSAVCHFFSPFHCNDVE